MAAGGNHNVFGMVGLAVHRYRVGIHKRSEAVNHIHAVFGQAVGVRSMNTLDIGLAALHQTGKIEALHGHIEAVVRRIAVDGFGHLGAIPHHFFGHTAHVNTGAAQ